jgi:hypothetical protein
MLQGSDHGDHPIPRDRGDLPNPWLPLIPESKFDLY